MYSFEIFFETFIMTSHMVNFCDYSILIQKSIYSASFGYGYVHIVSCIHRVCVCVCVCAQSCPTLSNPIGCTLPSPSVVEFSRQEYWRGLPFPTSRDFPHPGIEPTSLASSVLAGKFSTNVPPGKPLYMQYFNLINCVIYIHFLVYFFQWTFIPHLIICWTHF